MKFCHRCNAVAETCYMYLKVLGQLWVITHALSLILSKFYSSIFFYFWLLLQLVFQWSVCIWSYVYFFILGCILWILIIAYTSTEKNDQQDFHYSSTHCIPTLYGWGLSRYFFFTVETTLLLTKFKQKHFAKTNFLVSVTLIDFI